MVLETIFGGIIGGVTRLAPEVLGFFDKKNERKHELAMAEHNLKMAELQNAGKLAITDREVEGKQFEATYSALKASIEAQAKPTGIRWVDAFSAIIRPGVTSWLFVLYAVYKLAAFSLAYSANANLGEVIVAMWTPSDDAMLAAVLTFWFVARTYERATDRKFRA